jgi:hypothetical protein
LASKKSKGERMSTSMKNRKVKYVDFISRGI